MTPEQIAQVFVSGDIIAPNKKHLAIQNFEVIFAEYERLKIGLSELVLTLQDGIEKCDNAELRRGYKLVLAMIEDILDNGRSHP